MNIIEQYESLVGEGRWEEAIPVIRMIIERNPGIDTSWFNYGPCLDELGRHSEAAEAFVTAQEFNRTDWGIHYRIFRSFFLAGDFDQFLEFVYYSCDLNSEVIKSLCKGKDFKKLFAREDFKQLKAKYLQAR